jgi:hypothetical protein
MIVFGQMAPLGDLLEALKNQFDLPAKAVVLQDAFGRETGLGEGG